MRQAEDAGLRSRGVPRTDGHRLPARGPPAEAELRRRQPASDRPHRRRHRSVRGGRRASSTPVVTSTTRPRSAPAASCEASTANASCPTTRCSTSCGTSLRATSRASSGPIGDVAVGVSICEDAWNPSGPIADQADSGAELIVNLNASPYADGKHAAARADARHPGGRLVVRAGVRQPGRRTGRARVRRRLDGVRCRGRADRPRATVRRARHDPRRRGRAGVPQAPARPAWPADRPAAARSTSRVCDEVEVIRRPPVGRHRAGAPARDHAVARSRRRGLRRVRPRHP